ncbi:MAG: hypothetical protein ACI9OJ_002398 [Myxococcota bacterium]|jgi:hypothetical protein
MKPLLLWSQDMKRIFQSTSSIRWNTLKTVSVGLLALAASACSATDDGTIETLSTLAELEASQEQLGAIEVAAGGCLTGLATCFQDGGEACVDDFKACLPKPPKLEGLKEAAMACKAQAEAMGLEPKGPPAMEEGAAKPGQGEKPAKPEMPAGDAAAGDADELNCKGVKKALHKGKKHKGHMKKAVGPCIEELQACVEVDDVDACVAAARECVKTNVTEAFEAHCDKALTKCAEASDDDADLSAEKCEKMATRCEEGPKPPVAPPAPESAE